MTVFQYFSVNLTPKATLLSPFVLIKVTQPLTLKMTIFCLLLDRIETVWNQLTPKGNTPVPICPNWFTHETEKDKTRNVLLGMTKLRISKLGISKTEKLVWENPTLIGKYLKSNYEKTKNWEFLKWEYCHKTYKSNLRERQNWEIEIARIPISDNWIYRNDIW